MCDIEGCGGETVAKGLCAKHYMRRRRTGDPAVTRKPGVKADAMSKWIASEFPEWSPRTRARFKQAMLLLDGQTMEVKLEALQKARHGNGHGSKNVSRLVDIASMIAVWTPPAVPD